MLGKVVDTFIPEHKRFGFVTYDSPASARKALALDKKNLDKKHKFSVNLFSDFEKYGNFTELEIEEYDDYVAPDFLYNWLLDDKNRDQFMVTYDTTTEVRWNGVFGDESEMAFSTKDWAEGWVQWSPNGSYLALISDNKVTLLGGDDFKQVDVFEHPGVEACVFSPKENFIVTFTTKQTVFSVIYTHIRMKFLVSRFMIYLLRTAETLDSMLLIISLYGLHSNGLAMINTFLGLIMVV